MKTEKKIKKTIKEYSKPVDKIFKVESYVIPIDLFHVDIELLFGEDAIKLEKEWELKITGSAQTRDYTEVNNKILISFYEECDCDNLHNTIAHEATHATQIILRFIGYKNPNLVDELPAYLNGYIVGKIREAYETEKKRRKDKKKSKSKVLRGSQRAKKGS